MSKRTSFWATLPGCLVLIALAYMGYWLLREHSSHLVQWLPFSIILLCPLMHFFMHRGHGHADHKIIDQLHEGSPDESLNDTSDSKGGATSIDSTHPRVEK